MKVYYGAAIVNGKREQSDGFKTSKEARSWLKGLQSEGFSLGAPGVYSESVKKPKRVGAKRRKYNPSKYKVTKGIFREGWYTLRLLPKGEFIKRTPTAKKVYRKGEYDRTYKAFRVDDQDDISRDMLVRGSTKVWAGFIY